MRKIRAFNVILLLCIVSFFCVAFFFYVSWESSREIEETAKNRAKSETALAAKKLNTRITRTTLKINTLVSDIGTGKLGEKELPGELSRILENNPIISAIGMAYEPYAADPQVRLVFPLARENNRNMTFSDAGSEGDYTEASWYKEAMEKGAHWTEPYHDGYTKSVAVALVSPVAASVDGSSRPLGVVYVVFGISDLKELIGTINTGTSLYEFVISRKGTILYSPIRDQVETMLSLFEFARVSNQEYIATGAKKALNGESTFVEAIDKDTGQTGWIFFEPIETPGWVIGSIYFGERFAADEVTHRRQLVHIALSLIAFVTFLCVLVFRAWRLQKYSLWAVSFTFSFLCLGATFYMWYLVLFAPLYGDSDTGIIANKMKLHKFMNSYAQASRHRPGTGPYFIPTGISLQSLELTGPNSINIAGYIWQKYRKGAHDGLSRGFTLPEAQSVSIQEAYRDQEGDLETIGWHFEATVREYFDYQKYPFDRPDIWVWVQHRDFYRDVVLVPDIDSYRFYAPLMCPGLSENVVLPGYTYLVSYFDYKKIANNANFGIMTSKPGVVTPELFYHVIVRRQFMTPFVSKIFPLVIMLAMLFIVQLTLTREEERRKSFGLSGLTVIGTAITFFLSTLLSQGALRTELATKGVAFIENFYFITYFMLLDVVLVAYLFTGHNDLKVIHFEHCLIPKLLFWPIIAIFVLIMSLVNFY
jgi:hypothetical protein